MTDITFGTAAAAKTATAPVRDTAKKSFLRRLYDAMVEARMRQAEAIMKDYRKLFLPY